MSMGGFGFFRTIWLSIRATNYTTQAFQSAHKNLTDLQKAELQFAKNTMAVGVMYVAFGAIVIQTMATIMKSSALGEAVLSRFSERISGSMAKLGDGLARILGPILDVVASVLEIATSIPLFSEFAAVVMVGVTVLLFAAGAAKVLSGAMLLLSVMQGKSAASTLVNQQSLMAYIPTAHAATGATLSLGAAIGSVVAGFGIAFAIVTTIGSVFGKMPAIIVAVTIAIIGLAVAITALRAAAGDITAPVVFGASLAAGAAAGAAFIASQPEYQMGTRFAPRTMMAMIHAGEGVFNTNTQKPVGMMERVLGGGMERRVTKQDVHFHIGTLSTKTDIDDVEEKMARKTYNLFSLNR